MLARSQVAIPALNSWIETRRQSLKRLGLVARFTLVAAVVSVVIASALAYYIETRLTELLLDQVSRRAVDQIELAVANRLDAEDLTPPFIPERLQAVGDRLDPLRNRALEQASGILRLHVFGTDGTIVYSDQPSSRGRRVESPQLSDALSGNPSKGVSPLLSSYNVDLRERHGRALEVYAPIWLDGRVAGAFEIYQDMKEVGQLRMLVWGSLTGGFALLFFSLLAVVHNAANHIKQQEIEREQLVLQAAETRAEAERQNLLQQAAEARAEAEAARRLERIKDELVSVVSHELRTPLASIVGFSDLLLAGDFPDSERQRFLALIRSEGIRLSALIDDFLDLKRMESGQQQMLLKPTEAASLLAEAAAAAGDDPARPILLDIADDLPLVMAARDRVRQVLGNLLSNARKYSPEGGEIRVFARRVNETVEVEVRDRGMGIPREGLSRLFERFYRADNSDVRAVKGTGLGLMICRKIIEAHGGRIWAESTGRGRGACFFFTLPVAPTEMYKRGQSEAA